MSTGDDGRWHLKREIQIGHIVTTLTVAVSVVVYVGKIEQRLAVAESRIAAQRERDERQDKVLAEAMARLGAQLERLDGKLDHLVERIAAATAAERGKR